MRIIDYVKNSPVFLENKRYLSLFDDNKRITVYKAKLKIIGKTEESVWKCLQMFSLKGLKASIGKEKKIFEGNEFFSQKIKNCTFKVTAVSDLEYFIIECNYNNVLYYNLYCILKKKNYISVKCEQATIYPYILAGAQGLYTKGTNKAIFKSFEKEFKNYIKQNS